MVSGFRADVDDTSITAATENFQCDHRGGSVASEVSENESSVNSHEENKLNLDFTENNYNSKDNTDTHRCRRCCYCVTNGKFGHAFTAAPDNGKKMNKSVRCDDDNDRQVLTISSVTNIDVN